MIERMTAFGATVGGGNPVPVEGSLPAPPLQRLVGYCADCGTWDAHGPVCLACGYDFTGSEDPLPTD